MAHGARNSDGGLPQHSRLGSLRDAAHAWSSDCGKVLQAQAERKTLRVNSVVSSTTRMSPTRGRLRRVFVPVFELCAVILVSIAAIRAVDPATTAVVLIAAPRPEKAVRLPPSETTEISRPPPTSGFSILVHASLGEALPAIAEDVPSIIKIATPLPTSAQVGGFTIQTNLSQAAPLPPLPRTVAEFMAITRPLTQVTEPLGKSKTASVTATPGNKLKPKKKSTRPVSKRMQWWASAPWLTGLNPAHW